MVRCRQTIVTILLFQYTPNLKWVITQNSKLNDENVQLMMFHILIYQIIVKLMHLKILHLSFGIHF
jgi:hypothetical protein